MKRTKACFLYKKDSLFSAITVSSYLLHKSVILNSGAIIHIFNTITRFLNYRHALPDDYLFAGDTQVLILGYGEIDIELSGPAGRAIMHLYDMAYCENFACSIISLCQLRRHGYY